MTNLLGFFLCCCIAVAQDSDFLIHHTFEGGLSGWDTRGGHVRTVRDGDAHSLVFDYDLSSGTLSFLGLETKGGIAGFARMRFRVKADYDTSLFVGLTEPKPFSGRNAFVSVRGGTWEQIDLKLSDFGPGDYPALPLAVGPPIDLKRVQGFGISDAAYTLLNPTSNIARSFGLAAPSGKHTLLVQDFQVLKGSEASTSSRNVTIDRFDRGMLQWILFGKANFDIRTTTPLNEPAAEITTHTDQVGQPVALYRRVTNLVLDDTGGFEFDVASVTPSAIIASISVRTPEGIRNDLATVPMRVLGGRSPVHLKLPYARFQAGTNISILPQAIVTLTIARVSLSTGESTFWIGNVEAFRDQPAK